MSDVAPDYHPCGVCASYRDVCVYCREAMADAEKDAELTRLRTAHADLLALCDAADHARGLDPVSARTPAGRISTDTVRAVLGGGGDE